MVEFGRTETVFKKRGALREDYQPDQIVGRDQEIDQYHLALQPVINNEQPNNIFIYGKTGVGKTAVTRFLLNQLETDAQKYDDLTLNTEIINCENAHTSYQVAVTLVNRLRHPSNQLSKTGHSRTVVYDVLWDELDNLGGTFLLVLDEVDHMEDDSILYQLPRARANGHVSNAKIGIIGISNDLSFRQGLSPKVKSSLCEEEIQFPPYNATELIDILERRAEVAFHSDVVSEAAVKLCAAYGAQDAGDARQSLELLLKAGDIARGEDNTQLTEETVREAKTIIERGRVQEGISSLTEHGRVILYAVLTQHLEGDTPVRTRDIRPRYTRFIEDVGSDPLVPRRMRDHLGELTMLGIINATEQNDGRRGGSYREYALEMDVDIILEALEDTIRAVGVHESLEVIEREEETLEKYL